ncbi:hypothetical protein F5J12DRAFT_948084 [Pisolithus orientalis]|uniref:uncharacterized protein n=1 Tax=Pisolithus orientalis TaxID=936130 RepID=UPI0022240EED|nr:uncharacterized protein F5J12DRAFT_948084 [Pisolithus orientalis]KAI6002439.1 hypothetical protein F5J12DRAFT_948084 [Pisolithus orientalis]
MIKGFTNGSYGFLLDWEFAVWVMLQGEYDLGSTGTVPFLSVNILCQLKEAITKSGTNVPSIQKSASLTHIFIDHPTTIHHTFADNIKSLFYIFIWILILYDGPLGHECQDISHEKTLLGLWSEKVAEDLKITRCAKFTFLNDPSKSRLDSEVSQYFQDLIPLANEWHVLLGQSLLSGTAVQFSDTISLLDCFLASMLYKKPPEMMNAFQQIIAQHKALNLSMHPSQENNMDVMSLAIMSSKCLCEEKKGGGCSAGQNAKLKSNAAPPPYMPPIVNGPSPADMPLSSTAVATPVFHQCPTDSHCFGFSIPAQQLGHIMPPVMEPDLQVLNNPYIAAIQGDQVPSNTSHPPTPQPNYQSQFIPHQPPATIPDSCINPSLDSSLSSRQTSATTDVHHKSLEKLSSEGSSEEELESLSNNPSDAEAGEVSRNESDKEQDNAFGWGATNLRQSTHPGSMKDCLEDAKQECRAPHALSNPFPSKSHNLNLSITEVLITVIIEWNQHGVQFEDGYWPDHKQDMACLLLGDISTWSSELKSVTLATMPSTFNLIPPSDVAPQGKTRNFAHPTLKEAVIQFYYTRTYQIVDKHPESFNNSVPLSCLALIAAVYHCVLDGFVKNGTGKTMPQFSGKAYNSIFHGMMKVLNDILCNPYHSVRLHNQLSQWAKEGWAALQEVDSNVERYQHIQAVLD